MFAIAIIVYVLPKQGKFKYEFENLKGKPWHHDDLIAPFDFAINKSDEEINKELEEIKTSIKPYFRIDTIVYFERIQKYISQFEYEWDTEKLKNRKFHFNFGKALLDTIYSKGIIQHNEVIEGKSGNFLLNLVYNNFSEERLLSDFFTIKSADEYVLKQLHDHEKINAPFLLNLIENSIAHNVFYDSEFSEQALEQALDGISLTRDKIIKGQSIISKGEIVDAEKYQILVSLKGEYEISSTDKSDFIFILTGQIIISSLCMLLLAMFFFLFRNEVIQHNKQITFILILILFFVLMATIAHQFENVSLYVVPFCVLPIVVRAFFDTRIALFVYLITILLVALTATNRFDFLLIELLSGIAAIYSIVNMRNRSQIFITAGFVFLTYCFTFLGITIIQVGGVDSISWEDMTWFVISAGLTLFSYPLIYIFEKIFGFTSDVTLLELSDTNSPLLRELASKAPGTFQHSLQVANLAEEAVYELGGNPLLVRAGALYHDIGKAEAPMYFIENQASGINPHDDLPFEESASIIINHVINGIEKAKKHNLPEQLIDFIRTHHGTTTVAYFYKQYLKTYPENEVDMSMFQYPGPIPYSKETAVLMIADSVEAASRSLKMYDAESIGNLVDNIVNNLMDQKQFANADITFKDINRIKKILKKRLMNIYHVRVEYPR